MDDFFFERYESDLLHIRMPLHDRIRDRWLPGNRDRAFYKRGDIAGRIQNTVVNHFVRNAVSCILSAPGTSHAYRGRYLSE